MKRFAFRPERVLRLRTLETEQASRAVAAAAAALLQALDALTGAERAYSRWRQDVDRRRQGTLPCGQWLVDWSHLLGLHGRVDQAAAAVAAARGELADRQAALIACRSRQQALEKLRDLRRREHRRQVLASEQGLADDRAAHARRALLVQGGWPE